VTFYPDLTFVKNIVKEGRHFLVMKIRTLKGS